MAVHEDSEVVDEASQPQLRIHTMPPAPLQQLSPERLNQRLVQSPSLPLDLERSAAKMQHRLSDAADVKARIAMINSISQNGSPVRNRSPTKSQPGTPSQAALQRALLGREQAESGVSELAAQLESAKYRERLVAERAESLLEQLTTANARTNHERKVYEREVKMCRKNEYKAQMAVIQVQQDLQETKKQLDVVKTRAEREKMDKEKAGQEAFERAYAIQGITEEMASLREQLRLVRKERDTMLAVQEERQANVLPLAFMEPQTILNEASSPKKVEIASKAPEALDRPALSQEDMDLDVENCSPEVKCRRLEQQISRLQKEQRESQELIHFMNMQCQFLACPCRTAEREGVRFIHDHEYDEQVAHPSKKRKLAEQPPRKMMSWMQRRAAKMNQQKLLEDSQSTAYSKPTHHQDAQVASGPSSHVTIDEEMSAELAPLPPADPIAIDKVEAEVLMDVEAVAQIPLPSPTSTPEHTSQLEEITQMLVDPEASIKMFSFSTSTSERRPLLENVPQLSQSQSAVRLSDALFDISPPKTAIPRPSTAMGILTVASPIRVVHDSPDRDLSFSARDADAIESLPPHTTRVALNDTSPVRRARGVQHLQIGHDSRRSTRGQSPATDMGHPSSPASSTLFPITPMTKQVHAPRQSQTQPRPRKNHSQPADADMSITTTIPLRDDADSQSVDYASQALHVDNSNRPLKDPFAHIPGTPVTREAALAQIRARRDRARSVNTRRVKSEDMRGVKVDVTGEANSHANEGEEEARVTKTPGSMGRRHGLKVESLGVRLGLSQGDGDRGRGRDVSQASAPGRF